MGVLNVISISPFARQEKSSAAQAVISALDKPKSALLHNQEVKRTFLLPLNKELF